MWSSPKGSLVTALSSTSPLNCVTFDPEGHLVAAGGWDGAVRVWNWLKGEVTVSRMKDRIAARDVTLLNV